MSIPKRLKHCRKLLSFTQEEMAKAVEVNQKDISRFENGKVKFIPNHYLAFFAEHGINLNWLFTNTGPIWTEELSLASTDAIENKKLEELQTENLGLKEQVIVIKTENKVFKQQIKDLKSERKTLMEVFKTLGKGNLFK